MRGERFSCESSSMTRHPIETAAGEAFGSEPDSFEARPISWRLIVALLVIQVVGISAMVWAVFVKGAAE